MSEKEVKTVEKKARKFSAFYLVASIVLWLITIYWMYLIFSLSGESAELSTSRSDIYMTAINQIFSINLNGDIVRSFAHIIEYGFLALSTFLAIRFTNMISTTVSYAEAPKKIIKSDNELYILCSLWISLLYAVTDEYHQIFIPGRDGSIIDVLIDLIGIVSVLLIIRLIYSINLKVQRKKEERYE